MFNASSKKLTSVVFLLFLLGIVTGNIFTTRTWKSSVVTSQFSVSREVLKDMEPVIVYVTVPNKDVGQEFCSSGILRLQNVMPLPRL